MNIKLFHRQFISQDLRTPRFKINALLCLPFLNYHMILTQLQPSLFIETLTLNQTLTSHKHPNFSLLRCYYDCSGSVLSYHPWLCLIPDYFGNILDILGACTQQPWRFKRYSVKMGNP